MATVDPRMIRCLVLVVMCGLPAHCASAGSRSTGPSMAPASEQPGPSGGTPGTGKSAKAGGLKAFLTAAKEMDLEYYPPAGYSEVEVVDDTDVPYDYGIINEDRDIEVRFVIRPYPHGTPKKQKTLESSWTYFSKIVLDLTHGGETGGLSPPRELLGGHFDADDAWLVTVRWNEGNDEEGFFGHGYAGCLAIFTNRIYVGDAYTFILFKDAAVLDAGIDEDKMCFLKFSPGEMTEDPPEDWVGAAGGDPCYDYAKCCEAYAEALSRVEGVPEATLKGMRDGCEQAYDMMADTVYQETCKQGLVGIKQAMTAYESTPGFEIPPACK